MLVVPTQQSSHAMDNHLTHIHTLPDGYWWHDHRYRLAASWLNASPQAILDFGCGTGGFLRFLDQNMPQQRPLYGFDPSPVTNTVSADTLDARIRLLRDLPRERLFSTVTALDVLEHIQDDVSAVKSIKACMKPGGRLIVTVPASPVFWSQWDVSLGHFRRYDRAGLTKLLVEEGFTLEKASYFFSYLTAPALWRRWRNPALPGPAGDTAKVPEELEFRAVAPWMDTTLKFMAAQERSLLRHLNIPFGTSLLAVASYNNC